MGAPKSIPEELVALARRQGGLISRKQAALHGLTSRHLKRFVRLGSMKNQLRVFQLADATPAWVGRKSEPFQQAWIEAHSLALSLGPNTIVSGLAAAEILSTDIRSNDTGWRARFQVGSLLAYVPPNYSPHLSGVEVIRTPFIGDFHSRSGVRVAARSIALLDELILLYGTGGKVGVRRATPLLDFCLQRRWLDSLTLDRHVLALMAPREGGAQGRRLCAARWAAARARLGMESAAERLCGEILVAHGLLAGGTRGWIANFEVQTETDQCGPGRCRLDFAWPAQRVALEVDGEEFHAGYEAFERDRSRLRRLAAAGWTVLPVTWKALQTMPETVVAQLNTALTSRSACVSGRN